jgi:hypothetical protein
MKSIRIANVGALSCCLLAVACKSKGTPTEEQGVADRHLFNQIFCPVETDGEKTVREKDFTRTAFAGWLRAESDYQDYLCAWLKQNSKRDIVEKILTSEFLHADIKRNAVNAKIAIVDKKGRSKCLLDDDKGFAGFYGLDESGRISSIGNFCDQVFPEE